MRALCACSSIACVHALSGCNGVAVDSRDVEATLDHPDGGTAGSSDVDPSDPNTPGPYAQEVSEDYDALLETFDAYAEFFCECEAGATSGEDYAQCVQSSVQTFPPPVLACIKGVLGKSEASLESLRCRLENNTLYVDCIHENTCFDFDHITDCEIDRIIRSQECPEVPYDVWAENERLCWGRDAPAAFECGSGEQIDPELVCDVIRDCEDGSDEQNDDCSDPHAGLDL